MTDDPRPSLSEGRRLYERRLSTYEDNDASQAWFVKNGARLLELAEAAMAYNESSKILMDGRQIIPGQPEFVDACEKADAVKVLLERFRP